MCLTVNGYKDGDVWIYTFETVMNGNDEREITYW
jgi:hypothetical protein